MKKIILLLALSFGMAFSGMAKDTYAHDASALPQAAQTTVTNNFKAKVSVVKIEKTMGRVHEYEAVLSDGTEISFDRNGNWDNIEVANNASIPARLIPAGITEYVNSHHPHTRIVGINKERHGYDIDLSNGIEMKFDKNGQFIRYDD